MTSGVLVSCSVFVSEFAVPVVYCLQLCYLVIRRVLQSRVCGGDGS